MKHFLEVLPLFTRQEFLGELSGENQLSYSCFFVDNDSSDTPYFSERYNAI